MNIQIEIAPIIETLANHIWPFVRIGAFLMVMPLIGGSFVPTKVRLLLAVALTAVLAPVLPTMPNLDVLSAAGLVTMIQEIAIGVSMGFLVQLVFDAIALSGQVIGMSMGLGFAVFLDRARGVNVPVLGQLFLMLGMLTFLSMDGHLALIRLLAESFHAWPVSDQGTHDAGIVGPLALDGANVRLCPEDRTACDYGHPGREPVIRHHESGSTDTESVRRRFSGRHVIGFCGRFLKHGRIDRERLDIYRAYARHDFANA